MCVCMCERERIEFSNVCVCMCEREREDRV